VRPAISLGGLLGLLLMTAGCGDDDGSTRCTTAGDCAAGATCVDGSCQPVTPRPDGGPGSDAAAPDGSTCPAPRRICGGECVDLLRNPDHCGTCDALCVAPASCASGTCITPCTPADPPIELCNGVDDDCDGVVDDGLIDCIPPDAGPPDAGPPDAGPPDAGPPDASTPPDATVPTGDAGRCVSSDCPGWDVNGRAGPVGCGCRVGATGASAPLSWLLMGLLLLAVVFRRRARSSTTR